MLHYYGFPYQGSHNFVRHCEALVPKQSNSKISVFGFRLLAV